MKSLIVLWSAVAEELGDQCGISTTLDLQKARSRFEHEGVSFLTLSLPAFGKAFERSLEERRVDPGAFSGFSQKGGLPRFLGGFLDRVFDRSTGFLLERPCVDSIFAIRQLTLMFGKILLPCSDARNRDAIQGYLTCEKDVERFDESTSLEMYQDLQRMSNLLFADVFSLMDEDLYEGNIMGKHGPGKTADRLQGNAKYDLTEWPERLQSVFPFEEHALASPRWLPELSDSGVTERVRFLEPGAERPVKVTLVPKTLKTPRVIAIEPTAVQYMQQGIMEKLVEYLERDKLVRGMIGFTEQGPNQVLACKGSSNGLLATLDLSEASDRVSNQHVRVMLQRFPHFLEGVDATRSRKAAVFGQEITLAKFASMGSALCFPMEAMVFLSLVFLGIEAEHKNRFTRESFRRFSGSVRVYGDDIVVPVRFVPSVIRTLESFGFKVNSHKSFWNGKFRESCGRDYYDGTDVSIVRVRRVLPESRADVEEIVSCVELRNQLYFAGLWRSSAHLDARLKPMLQHYPVLAPDSMSFDRNGRWTTASPLLGRVSVSFAPKAEGTHSDYQCPMVKGWVVSSRPPISKISEHGALLKGFLKRGDQPIADRDHFERQGRPQSVRIKLRWKSPH